MSRKEMAAFGLMAAFGVAMIVYLVLMLRELMTWL